MKRSTIRATLSASSKRARANPDDDFYASDEDRRLCEFAAGLPGSSRLDGVCSISADEIQQHKAGDDFVALYDGWEEDMEEIVIIPDEGDDAAFALQHGGFHGFDTSEEEEEEDAEADEEVTANPNDLQQFYEFVLSRRRWVKEFGVFGFATQFCLKNLERIDDVMQLVEDTVHHLIDQATHRADREAFKGWIGFGLKTEDGKQWYIPIRPAEQNTAHKIARSIEKYDQSSNSAAFCGKRVTFDITVINEPRGAGHRKGAAITKHHNTNADNIVIIPLEGRDCFAGAVSASLYYYNYREAAQARSDKKCKDQWRAVERFIASSGFLGAVERLKHDVNLPVLSAYGVDHARAIQKHLQEASPDKYQIVIFAEKSGITPIWKGDVINPKHRVYIHLHDKHYDVMKSPERFYGLRNYCVSCEVKYGQADQHSRMRAIRCPDCLRMGHGYPCQRDTKYDGPKYNGFDYDEHGDKIERGPFPCRVCNREFVSKSCFEAHKANACKTFHRCGFCTNVYRVKNHKKNGGHRCGERFCRLCKAFHSKKNGCYIRPLVSKEVTDYRVVALDFECDITLKTDEPKKKRHRPNYAVVMVTCTQCMDKTGKWSNLDCTDCETCGPVKYKTFSDWDDGGDAVQAVLSFLFKDLPGECMTFCYAHNGAKYDVQFVIDVMCMRGGQLPHITSNGNKIMQLGIEAKQFFPYRYNTPANYDRPLKALPPMDDYIPSAMSDKKRDKFAEWWAAENAKQPDFDLKAQLKEYCTNDVWILLKALYKYRELTNTSAALSIFKKKYVKEKQLAIVPNNGYGRQERQSAKGMKFLKWFAQAHGIEVQHRDSDGGERKVEGTNYRLDGYIAADAKQSAGYQPCDWQHCLFCAKDFDGHIALEFNGCQYHGCRWCFSNRMQLRTGKDSDEAWQETLRRAEEINQKGYSVIGVNECQIDEELEQNPEMRQFFEDCNDTGHICPREGLFGGRVGPLQMYYKPKEDEEIKYFDIVSLYPFVLRHKFPTDHSQVIRKFQSKVWDSVDHPEYKKYRGIFKVLLLPPQDQYFPVAPMKDDERLLFQLCRTCSEASRKASPYREPGCAHTDHQRAYVVTLTLVELDLALQHGYKVFGPTEAWHWSKDKWCDSIFKDYINDFLVMKVEASGWPEYIKKIEDPDEKERAKDAFVEAYRQREGIVINKANVEKNEPRRYFAKRMLNSLWGRFAMRNNKTKTELVSKSTRLYELLYDVTKEVQTVQPLGNGILRVGWRYKDRMDLEDENSNVVIAMFTTAYGRAELFKHM
ncbi:hypothetical protein AAVH_29259 [Aphelenchoides avenae]|nr:hypothetical protein AAVH_29259 [Aphelenchus avenae]